jgi:hypothetical protein
MTHEEPPPGYRTALSFWRWWHGDPYSDQKLRTPPDQAIEMTLVTREGCTPDQALRASQLALDQVILEMDRE